MNLRWYRLQVTTSDIAKVRRHLFDHRYSYGENTSGFILNEAKDYIISGEFVEEVAITQDVYDPRYGMTQVETTVYNLSKFRLSTTSVPLEVVYGRFGASSMLRNLVQPLGTERTFEPIAIDILRFLKQMERDGLSPRVSEIRLSSVVLSATAQASLLVRGTGDLINASRILIADRKHRVSSIRISHLDGCTCDCKISERGICSVSEDNPQIVIDVLRDAVYKHMKEKTQGKN
jgi:hypothetical protein